MIDDGGVKEIAHLSDSLEVMIQQRCDEALMALDLIERGRQNDGLPDEFASERRVEREVERERREVLCCDLEAEDFSFVGEREDDRVRYRRDVRFRGHDQLEGGPGLEVVIRVGGSVEFDCWDRIAVEGGGAGEGVTEGELDEAAFVEASREGREKVMDQQGDETSIKRRRAH